MRPAQRIVNIVLSGDVLPAPVNTVLPSISGTTTVGQTLTGDDGDWLYNPTSYSRQWKRSGVNIGSATNSTYVLVDADFGHTITYHVTATGPGGTSATADSAATGAVVLDTDFSALSDGPLPSYLAGSTWSIVGGKAINTPVTFGADGVVNGGFATDTVWGKGTGWAIASGKATKTPSGATNINQVITGQAKGQWRRVDFELLDYAAGGVRVELGNTNIGPYRTANGTHQQVGTIHSTTLETRLWMTNDAAFSGSIDNVTNRTMDIKEMFATFSTSIADVTLQIPISAINLGTPVGLVVNLDSITNPQNYVVAWLGPAARIDKVVAGVVTTVVSAGFVFTANHIFKLVKTGTTYRMSYNGVQLGPDGTISDAGIINNTIHGIFSGHPDNQIGAVGAQP